MDSDLIHLLEHGGLLAVPYFNGEQLQVLACDTAVAPALRALKNFLQFSNAQRLEDGRHLLAYCAFMVDELGDGHLESVGGVLPNHETIWDFVDGVNLFFSTPWDDEEALQQSVYLQIEANVAWEREHGLQMTCANGNWLTKVSEFNGHKRHSAQQRDKPYIFYCYDERFATYADGYDT